MIRSHCVFRMLIILNIASPINASFSLNFVDVFHYHFIAAAIIKLQSLQTIYWNVYSHSLFLSLSFALQLCLLLLLVVLLLESSKIHKFQSMAHVFVNVHISNGACLFERILLKFYANSHASNTSNPNVNVNKFKNEQTRNE